MGAGELKILLKEGSLLLNNKDFENASEFFDDLLDNYPCCAQAYLGLLMAELHVNTFSQLGYADIDLKESCNFNRAVKFSDSSFKKKLMLVQKTNEAHIQEKQKENAESSNENQDNISEKTVISNDSVITDEIAIPEDATVSEEVAITEETNITPEIIVTNVYEKAENIADTKVIEQQSEVSDDDVATYTDASNDFSESIEVDQNQVDEINQNDSSVENSSEVQSEGQDDNYEVSSDENSNSNNNTEIDSETTVSNETMQEISSVSSTLSTKTTSDEVPLQTNKTKESDVAKKVIVKNKPLKPISNINVKKVAEKNNPQKEFVTRPNRNYKSIGIYACVLVVIVGIAGSAMYFSNSKDLENNKSEQLEKQVAKHNTNAKKEKEVVQPKVVKKKAESNIDFSKPISFTIEYESFEMMPCKGGSFIMGSPAKELGHQSNEVQKKYEVESFFIGKYEITQQLYYSLTKENPSKFESENKPVDSITWIEAKRFCSLLNEKTKSARPKGYSFKLPTEIQWEYACRGNTETSLYNNKNITSLDGECSNLDEIAWYKSNSFGSSHEVGMKQPNKFGLYDMLGNVSEWCEDIAEKISDDTVDTSNDVHIIRGGSWINKPSGCRSANRDKGGANQSFVTYGFRIVLSYDSIEEK